MDVEPCIDPSTQPLDEALTAWLWQLYRRQKLRSNVTPTGAEQSQFSYAYKSLQQLRDEGYQPVIHHNSLHITLPPVQLRLEFEDKDGEQKTYVIEFGRFTAIFDLSLDVSLLPDPAAEARVRRLAELRNAVVTATTDQERDEAKKAWLDAVAVNEPRYSCNNYIHPHVSPVGGVCLGAAGTYFNQAWSRWDFLSMVDLLTAVLREYNPDSPFAVLESWLPFVCNSCKRTASEPLALCEGCSQPHCENCDTVSGCECETPCRPCCCDRCNMCDDISCSSQQVLCNGCETYGCDSCVKSSCGSCDDDYCSECSDDWPSCVGCDSSMCSTCRSNSAGCNNCGDRVCDNCDHLLESCSNCDESFCQHCGNSCEDCGQFFCRSCVDGSLCTSCEEAREDTEDEEDEEHEDAEEEEETGSAAAETAET